MPYSHPNAEQDPEELLEGILSRSSTDWEFRKALLRDPKDAIYDAFGVKVPEGYRLRFRERQAELDQEVILPDFVDSEHELSDDDLAAVHGGDGGGGNPPSW